ncbi:hypothetical protein BASA81_001395 [Batrachochytrium salamandrivorans]|nr:hypothetical protein BASA81_001395 [Batrachochytrium salamandrivorans]
MAQVVARLNQQELENKVSDSASWHNDYKDTSWVKVLGLHSALSEGDILCVFSQFGEIDDLNVVREAGTGRIRLCLIKYEQFKSAWLTVDNFNGAELLSQRLQVDHHRESVKRRRKRGEEDLSFADRLDRVQPGQAYAEDGASDGLSLSQGHDVFAAPAKRVKTWKLSSRNHEEEDDEGKKQKKKKHRKKERE